MSVINKNPRTFSNSQNKNRCNVHNVYTVKLIKMYNQVKLNKDQQVCKDKKKCDLIDSNCCHFFYILIKGKKKSELPLVLGRPELLVGHYGGS